MNHLKTMQAAGFTWPSPAYLWGAILFGLLGYAAFRRGRKTEQWDLMGIGVALMVFPYFVGQAWLLWTLGAALTVWAFSRWK